MVHFKVLNLKIRGGYILKFKHLIIIVVMMLLFLGGCTTKNSSRSIDEIINENDVIEYVHIKDNVYACLYKTTVNNQNNPDVIFVSKIEDDKWEILSDSKWKEDSINSIDIYFDKYFWDKENSDGVYIAYGKIKVKTKIKENGKLKDLVIDTLEITLPNNEEKNATIVDKYGEQYFYCPFMSNGEDFFNGLGYELQGKSNNIQVIIFNRGTF